MTDCFHCDTVMRRRAGYPMGGSFCGPATVPELGEDVDRLYAKQKPTIDRTGWTQHGVTPVSGCLKFYRECNVWMMRLPCRVFGVWTASWRVPKLFPARGVDDVLRCGGSILGGFSKGQCR